MAPTMRPIRSIQINVLSLVGGGMFKTRRMGYGVHIRFEG